MEGGKGKKNEILLQKVTKQALNIFGNNIHDQQPV